MYSVYFIKLIIFANLKLYYKTKSQCNLHKNRKIAKLLSISNNNI